MAINFGTNDKFSMQELYDVTLSATYNLEIGGKTFEPGEVIAEFDRINISATSEIKSHVAARGGFDNRAWVNWDETKEVQFSFSQGIFSVSQFALLSNSRLLDIQPQSEAGIKIKQKEFLESNEEGILTLKQEPIDGTLFIYSQDGDKLGYDKIEGTQYQINEPYQDVIVRYEWVYVNGASVIILGRRLLTGYVTLEGKTKLKDDNTGKVVTGLITIPRLKLMSDLSMYLGSQANPVVANFQAIGYPVGDKGRKEVYTIVALNDDIDADI